MKRFCELTEKEFDEFSRSFRPASFLQSVAMGKSQTDRGLPAYYYGLKEGNEITAAGLFTLRPCMKFFKIMVADDGILIDYNNVEELELFRQGLVEHLENKGVAQVRILPNFILVERDIDGSIVEGGFDNHHLVDNLKQAGFTHHGYHNRYATEDTRWFFYKDLSEINSEDELMSSFGGQARWAVRKTIRYGIRVRDFKYSELAEFNRILEHTADRRGFDNRGLEYYNTIFKYFSQTGDARFMVAELDLDVYEKKLNEMRAEEVAELEEATERHEEIPTRKMENRINEARKAIEGLDAKLEELETLRKDGPVIPLATAVFVRYADKITYLFSGAYDQYLSFNAPYALQWEAMKWALKSGIPTYDFYGTAGKYADYEDEGVYHFKKGFGGVVIEKPGTFSAVTSPFRYKILKFISKLFPSHEEE